MALIASTSPHFRHTQTTGTFMRKVIYACIPGLAALTWFFGWGTLINVLWASLLAVGFEAAVLAIRNKPVAFFLRDNSAILTAVLLALAIPPSSPWWVTMTGIFFAIVITKQIYGGLGSNPFNPAMAGYVLLLISFPREMTAWFGPADLATNGTPSFVDSLQIIFQPAQYDGMTMATPLDTFKAYAGDATALANHGILHGTIAGVGWEWVNMAFLLGGLYLLVAKIITWHIPATFLAGMAIPATIAWIVDPVLFASPAFHLLSGGTMLGAFFIATDPVTAATSVKGKLFYGFVTGFLVYVIRTWGGYPDAVAFSVLLMNLAAPSIDYYTQPRTYGHSVPNKGLPK